MTVKHLLDRKSRELLKTRIGKYLGKIGYVYDPTASFKTIFCFEDMIVEGRNHVFLHESGEEYAELSFTPYNGDEAFAFEKEAFTFIPVEKPVTHIKVIRDKIMFQGELLYDMENLVAFQTKNETISVLARDTAGEYLELFWGLTSLDGPLSIKELWDTAGGRLS